MENAARVYSHGSEQWSLSNSIQELEGTQFIEKDMIEPMGMFGSNNDSPLPEEPTAEGNFNLYEENCPYRRDELFKFRLIESFSDGLVYTGDSFGDRSYIDADERRECLAPCLCNQHNSIPEAFVFVAFKSLGQLAIAIHSRDLYLELISIMSLEKLSVEGMDQTNTVNGLALLKNYSTLKAHLNTIQSNPHVLGSLVLEMMLLLDGFLADGEIFRSYGYEHLYESGFLTYDHWKEFQQAQLEKDISALEQSYYELHNDLDFNEEFYIPPAQSNLLGQEAREIEPKVLNISDFASLTSRQATLAIMAGDKDLIRMFLERRAELTEEDLEALSENTANVSGLGLAHPDRDEELQYLLLDAINSGHKGIVRLLLDHGAYVKYHHLHDSPLEAAVQSGHEGIVRLLLDHGAYRVFRSFQDYRGTAMAHAVESGHEGIVRLLLDHGADANGGNHTEKFWHLSPLEIAVDSGHEGIVRLLLDHGANFNYENLYASLELAVKSGHKDIVRLLLDYGADVTTALNIMRQNGHKSLIRFYRSPVLQEALAAHKSAVENTYSLQYYTERRQRLQALHKKFDEQMIMLKMATLQSVTSFRNLDETLNDHRKAWAYGITTLRRLCKGKVHHDLAHTLAFLCLAKAISEAQDKNGACENSTDFFQDLERWQILFEADPTSLEAYKEAVRLMWGIELNQRVNASEKAPQLETILYFQALASALVNQTRELFAYPCNPNDNGLERNQECWRQRFSQNSSNSENSYSLLGSQSSGGTGTQVLEAKDPKPPDIQYPDPLPPDPKSPQKKSVLREQVNHDITSVGMSRVVTVLMAGAIFAIVLLYLKWLQDTSSRVSYHSSVAVSRVDMEFQQVNVKHAADNIISRLQQTAPSITYTIAKLKDHLGQVLKQSRVTCFSKLKNAFAGCTSSSKLGCTETEAVVIQKIIHQTCNFYEPVYALQERHRNLESYMNLRDRIMIVPRSPASSTPVAAPNGSNTSDAASTCRTSPNLAAQSPREGRSYTSPSFCQDCQRDFRSVSNFNKHRRDKHVGVRYRCRYCTKDFSRNSYKNTHERTEH